MEFFEAPVFTRYVYEYVDDESYRALQVELTSFPERGPVMPAHRRVS